MVLKFVLDSKEINTDKFKFHYNKILREGSFLKDFHEIFSET